MEENALDPSAQPVTTPVHHRMSPSRSSPLFTAVRGGDLDSVRKLLETEDVNSRDYYKNTCLHLVVTKGDLRLLQALLSRPDVDLDAREGVHERSPLHLCASQGNSACMAALISRGAVIDPRNFQMETPAHKAAQHGYFDVLELLISSGCDKDAADTHGRTPMHRASELGSVECVKLLVVAGANLNMADISGRTPLHCSGFRGRLGCVQVLMENGADCRLLDASNRSAEETSRLAGYEECAKAIGLGAQLMRRKKRGAVALWTVVDCVGWAREEQLGEAVGEAMALHDVTGDLLMQIDEAVLRDELGISSWGTRRKTLAALEVLLTARSSEGGDVVPLAGAGAFARSVLFEELAIGELLGVGNFGEVKRASWRGTDVAVKVIYRKAFHDHDQKQLFQKEVDIISQLHHPNVVQFIGTCASPEGHFCLVTEFCGGGSLRQLIAENSAALLRSNLRNRVARDVCKAMVHLHKWKPPILHRDLTSSNLLLDHSLTCKLADFGLSRESFRDRTLTGGFGAVAWMDPMVLTGHAYTTKSDVYAFGMCCYEMTAMTVPHHGHPPLRFAEMACKGHRPLIGPSTPAEWISLISQCWNQNPSARPSFPELLLQVEGMSVQPDAPTAPLSDSAAAVETNWNNLAGSDGYIDGAVEFAFK